MQSQLWRLFFQPVVQKVRLPHLDGRYADIVQNSLKPFCAVSLKARHKRNLFCYRDGQQGIRKWKRKKTVGIPSIFICCRNSNPYLKVLTEECVVLNRRGWHLPPFSSGGRCIFILNLLYIDNRDIQWHTRTVMSLKPKQTWFTENQIQRSRKMSYLDTIL